MYPNIRVALVSVPTEPLDDVEEARVADRLTTVSHNGITYRMVGASGSAKNGKYYYCDIQHEPLIAKRFQQWPEAAITYFGILVSGCKVVHTEPKATVMVVRDLVLGTNDCRGWIRRSLFHKLALPEGHFYQFRLAFDSIQAKGSFKVMSNDVADALGTDIVIPDSSIKPGIKMPGVIPSLFGFGAHVYKCPITLGIREVSRPLQFESSYTVLQHAPAESIETEIVPQAVETIETLKTAWRQGNHRKVVELIGQQVSQDDSDGEPFQRVVEAALLADGSGEITRHPYVHAQLSRLMARWAYKLMTGGGVELPAFALADDGFLVLQRGEVVSGADWMPLTAAITCLSSNHGLCVRYSKAEEGEYQPFVSVIMDEFSPFAYENFAHILVTARGANVGFLFALQSAPQLLQVGRGFRNDVSSAPNTTFMLRTKDEETAKYFLNASARVRQMRRSMRVLKKGVFNPEFEEGTEGSQTEIKDTLAQDEHIKKMPVGQMEMLVTDPFLGTIHKHLHIRKASSHWLPRVPINVYPKLDTLESESHGLNLSFPVPDLEEKRQRRRKK
jgi:TraM recognition site of TraD and TraG